MLVFILISTEENLVPFLCCCFAKVLLSPFTESKVASSKIQGRDNITIGTWNTRTLRAAGKLLELTHEMDRYRWNILGLCEMRWKNFGKQQQRKDPRFSSVEKRISTSMALDFLFARAS